METSFCNAKEKGTVPRYLRLLYHALWNPCNGLPSPEDDHGHHGEIPYVTYDSAGIVTGSDEKAGILQLRANTNIIVHSAATILPGQWQSFMKAALIDVSMEVQNKSREAMDLMYMCHINNKTEAGAEVFQILPWTPEHMVVRVSIPQYNTPDPAFMELWDVQRIKGQKS